MAGRDDISREELALATRNHGTPLEMLREPITPLGLHYLLTHYDVPRVDPADWRLSVDGLVREPLSLSLDDLRSRDSRTVAVTMECAGNGRALLSPRPLSQPWLVEAVGTAEWTGAALRPLLEEAGVREDAIEILFSGLDRGFEGGVEQRYERSLPLAEALRDEVLLAYAVNGEPLPSQHGFPLRLVVPGWYGMTNVKWLTRISALAEPFDGYQQRWAYRFRASEDEPGTLVTRIMPRALMVPPGIPDFTSRERFVAPGLCRLEGRAWSGWGSIERVEVSVDDGLTWASAELGEAPSSFAWRSWSYAWDAVDPGRRVLSCRAVDSAGNEQPVEPPWNLGGYANNSPHRVPVTVLASAA